MYSRGFQTGSVAGDMPPISLLQKMNTNETRFPNKFVWGVATSSYQIEGAAAVDGKAPSIWDTFSAEEGNISDGSSGETGCDHYARLEEDLDLIVQLGIPAYRFSISWPRVQPAGKGAWNQKGLDFYDRLIDGLAKRNIAAYVTLYHWDLPQALQDEGGWANRDTAYHFAEYARVLAARYGDRVRSIATHNEPWVVAVLGHETGIFAPGIKDRKTALQVSHHLLLSHGLAVNAIRELGVSAELGIVLNQSPIYPATESDADIAKAKIEDGLLVRWYMDPLFRGEYPSDILEHLGADAPVIKPGDLDIIRTPIDFLGINYYTRNFASSGNPWAPKPGPLGVTGMGWEVYPEGITDLLLRLARDYPLPAILITENGAAYSDEVIGSRVHDVKRTEYLQMHIAAVADAIAGGVDVRGYFAWSLFDNFEWALGYSKRFGIVYVDFETQKRTPKDSACWYRDFIASQQQKVAA